MRRKGSISKSYLLLLLGVPIASSRRIRRACELCAVHNDPSLTTLLISGQKNYIKSQGGVHNRLKPELVRLLCEYFDECVVEMPDARGVAILRCVAMKWVFSRACSICAFVYLRVLHLICVLRLSSSLPENLSSHCAALICFLIHVMCSDPNIGSNVQMVKNFKRLHADQMKIGVSTIWAHKKIWMHLRGLKKVLKGLYKYKLTCR